MVIVYILAGVILSTLMSWLILMKPSGKKHPNEPEMRKFIYAHRGLHDKNIGIPENSMAAFDRAVSEGYGIELDVHLSKDGTPVIMHDPSLLRTAGVDIAVTDIPDRDIKKYPLEGTGERIPLFSEVLTDVDGKVPLLIELKVDSDNYEALCEATVKTLAGYNGIYAVQSFDPRAIKYLRIKYPDVMRGQLSGFLVKSGAELNRFLDFGLRNLLTNYMTKPHFIAYRVKDSRKLSVSVCRKLYRPLEFNWTCRKKAHHVIAHKNGAIPIFEKYIPKGHGAPTQTAL